MFDSVFGGLGGCFFVFKVIGNVVIEEFVYLFVCSGILIGFDFDVLFVVNVWFVEIMGCVLLSCVGWVGDFIVIKE